MGDMEQRTWENYPVALPKDTILAGKYIIKDVLGQGGFGITYLAEDYKKGIKVAVKEYFPESMATRYPASLEIRTYTDERLDNFRFGMESFLDEAKVLAEFQGNPHIVGVQSYFEENSTAYFVMDYIEGIDFKTYIKQHGGKLPWEDVWKIMSPIMEALDSVHKKGLVHRDVTPDNIFISNDHTVKLLDFGAARYSLGDRSKSLDVVLKPGYAPREQYTRRGRQGPFTDVYSVAACFYASLSGFLPPESLDRVDVDELVPLSARGVKLPPGAEKAIMKGLEVRAENRFQTMELFRQAILHPEEDIHTETNTYAETDTLTEAQGSDRKEDTDVEAPQIQEVKNTGKKRAALIGGAAAVFVIVVCGIVYSGNSSKSSGSQNTSVVRNEVPQDIKYSETDETTNDESRTGGSEILPEPEIAESNEGNPPVRQSNILMKEMLVADEYGELYPSGVLGNTEIDRASIEEISFVSSLYDMPDNAWDVSKSQNGSVMAWIEDGNELVIAADGEIAMDSGTNLFSDYINVKNIHFNHCVDTSEVMDMSYMFLYCNSLEELDLSDFDTRRVTNMQGMFFDCTSLIKLDVTSFDTRKVTDMSYMFCGCGKLTSLDLLGFETDRSPDMTSMFDGAAVTAEKAGFIQ